MTPATHRFERIHHVLLAVPAGGEDACRAFWSGLLGMVEVDKPTELAARGGCWFRGGGVEIHLGVEQEPVPARKAHPAFLVTGIDALAGRLVDGGAPVRWSETFPGHRRFHTSDPFGNRLEFLESSV